MYYEKWTADCLKQSVFEKNEQGTPEGKGWLYQDWEDVCNEWNVTEK